MSVPDPMNRSETACLGALLWAGGVLSMNSHARVPGWDLNPIVAWTGEASLTPGQALIAIGIAIFAAAVLWFRNRAGGSICAILFVIGGFAVFAHGLLLVPETAGDAANPPRGDLDSLITGSAWFAGLCAAWAIATCRDRLAAVRLTMATLAVFLCIIAAKALFERFVECPQMIETYRADPQGAQLAQGMDPGSSRALAYERRILGGHPTGWFGLSNVLASFMGAGLILSTSAAAYAWRRGRSDQTGSGPAGAAILMALVFGTALAFTGSTAAIGLTIAVLLVLGLAVCFSRCRRFLTSHPRLVLLTPSILVLTMVLARATLLGEGSERSILFRWHYWLGTLRVWAEQFVFGAGPGGFQAAYTRLKPPISPENVQTPHSIPADWLGTLGLFGLLWLVALGVWASRLRRIDRDEDPSQTTSSNVPTVPFALGVSISVLVASAAVQWPVWLVSPDLVAILLLGVAVGAAASWLVAAWVKDSPRVRFSLLAAASFILAHGMFDVAPARPASAILFWVIVGLAAPVVARERRKSSAAISLALAIGALTVLGTGLSHATRVDSGILQAARSASRLSEQTQRSASSSVAESVETRFREALEQAWPSWMEAELKYMTLRASLSLLLQNASPGGRDLIDLCSTTADRWASSVSAQARVAAILGALPPTSPAQQRAADAAIRAAELSPHDAAPAYNAFDQLVQAGRVEEAQHWARAALQNAHQSTMDPLAGLTEDQVLYIARVFPDLVTRRFSDSDAGDTGEPEPDQPNL